MTSVVIRFCKRVLPALLFGALLATPLAAHAADTGDAGQSVVVAPNIGTPGATPGSASVRLTWDGTTITYSARAVGWDSRATTCIKWKFYLQDRDTFEWKLIDSGQKCGTTTVQTPDHTFCPNSSAYRAAMVEGDAVGPGGDDTAFKTVQLK